MESRRQGRDRQEGEGMLKYFESPLPEDDRDEVEKEVELFRSPKS